ncbi:MAG: PhzF family phenazine biosynthesis protein [Pyrinomonadaceae bacterium]|nr:PhzF family phenazine biosynthesis protein [Pyrinomonadaceae bacterium]
MRKYRYYTLDVFTNKPFSGNPLAVFPEAGGITDEEMQSIANELNLSETVFVLDSETALKRLRIFTPSQELPLAGHPVVGTWNLLATLEITPQTDDGSIRIEQELKLGVLPVTLNFKNGQIETVEMRQGAFEAANTIDSPPDRAALAEALGLEQNDLGNERTEIIQVVSTGIRSIAVPVKSLEVQKRISVKPDELADIYLKYGAVGAYTFSFETLDSDSLVHARFFAPADGIPEDPATGSAAGALSGYLVNNGVVSESEFVIEQGDLMGRPSRIFAKVDGSKGEVKAVYIKGKAVILMEGTLSLETDD